MNISKFKINIVQYNTLNVIKQNCDYSRNKGLDLGVNNLWQKVSTIEDVLILSLIRLQQGWGGELFKYLVSQIVHWILLLHLPS